MSFLATLLLTLLPMNAHAHEELVAEEPVEVSDLEMRFETQEFPDQSPIDVPEKLVILGKGIENKKTGESIAIACVGTAPVPCEYLRVVRFDPNHLPSWDGNAFQISSVKAFSKELKKKYRENYRVKFKRVHIKKMNVKLLKRKEKNSRMMGGFIAIAVGLPAAAHGILAGTLLNPGVWPFVVVGMGGLLMWQLNLDPVALTVNAVLIPSEAITNSTLWTAELLANTLSYPVRGIGNALVNGTSQQTQLMTAQTGWNWVESPKRLSDRKFSRIKAVLSEMR